MTFPRTLCLLIGAAVGLGAVLWLDGNTPPVGLTAVSSVAWAVIQGLIALATAAVAMLATAAGALVASDWEADVESRQAWAQLGLTPAQLSLPVDAGVAWNIDAGYLPSADNAALRQVFRAHRFALPMAVDRGITGVPVDIRVACTMLASAEPMPQQRMRDAASKSVRDRGHDTRGLFEADSSDRALAKLGDTGVAIALKVARPYRAAKFRVKRAAVRSRLVANSRAWSGCPACYAPIPASTTADVIVLSSSQDDRALPDVPVGSSDSDSTRPPSCRGPPEVVARQARSAGTTSEQRWFNRADAVSVADPGHMLQDLLASSTTKPDSEKT